MRVVTAVSVLAVLATLHIAHAQPAALATPALNNTTRLESYLNGNFTAANITKPNALESRTEAGIVPTIGSSDLTCTFHLLGQGITEAVDVLSLDPSTQATGLESASISCTGPGGATFQGGSALAAFTSNFSGSHSDCCVNVKRSLSPTSTSSLYLAL